MRGLNPPLPGTRVRNPALQLQRWFGPGCDPIDGRFAARVGLAGMLGALLLLPTCRALPRPAGPGPVAAGQAGPLPGRPAGAGAPPLADLPPGGVSLDLAPRQQWNANFGYCGEVSFIVAGLSFGQYLSQFEARAVASGGADQSQAGSQLLLGGNDSTFAARSHLDLERWPGGSDSQLLDWIRGHLAAHHPVILGLYANQRRLEGRLDPLAGSGEYDHIVTVLGVQPGGPAAPAAAGRDPQWQLIFSDHGLVDGDLAGTSDFRFAVPFSRFARNRVEANGEQAPVYSLPKGVPIFAVAVLGVTDRHRETLPVRLSPASRSETPELANGSRQRPPARPLALTITVSGLRPGQAYRLYRYDSLAAIPESRFNGQAQAAARQWTLQGRQGSSSVSLSETIRSDAVAAYRAVPITAP